MSYISKFYKDHVCGLEYAWSCRARCHMASRMKSVIMRRQIGRQVDILPRASECIVRTLLYCYHLTVNSILPLSSLSVNSACGLSVCHSVRTHVCVFVCLTNDINAHNNYFLNANSTRRMPGLTVVLYVCPAVANLLNYRSRAYNWVLPLYVRSELHARGSLI